VHEDAGAKQTRYLGDGSTRVMGKGRTGNGSNIRVAAYNVHVDYDDWTRRAARVVSTIKSRDPGIVLAQELYAKMVDPLQRALADGGLARYHLTRSGPLQGSEGLPLQNRILYDTSRYQMTSDCPETQRSCVIEMESDRAPDYAAYAKFRDLDSGREFWVVSLHLNNGDDERMRTREMEQILTKVDQFRGDLPVIVGGDSNSSQLREGHIAHDVLMEHGYYDTASTQRQVNARYGTFNGYLRQKPSPFGVSPRIDLIATLGMPGSARFENMVVPADEAFPSDHNMIVSDLRLPAP
jgi:endonuclease/exonuclease/phosphatase family metal-dependent hydrolase